MSAINLAQYPSVGFWARWPGAGPHRVGWLCCALLLAGAAPAFAVDVAGITIRDGCASIECHGNMLSRPVVHSAVEMEMCDACHVPEDDRHVFAPVADPPDLCLECHDAFPQDDRTHEIVAMGECLACHDPHGSKVPELLAADSVRAACLECHDDPAAGFTAQHGPARDGDCLACHAPHHAKQDYLLKVDETELCLTCHARVQRRKVGAAVTNIGGLLKQKTNIHPPVEMGECLVCHAPHGSDTPPTLREAYPAGLYAVFSPDAYLTCFQCHDEALATDENSTETGFRDGTRNLHYLHVNKTKGRSCRACHEAHATNLPHLLRESVPFGEWAFSLRYEETPTGGGCWPGCHKQVTYDRARVSESLLTSP